MGVKICPSCTGNGWEFTPTDNKETCTTCDGGGAVESSDPEDEWKQAVIINGRTEIRDIDMTR